MGSSERMRNFFIGFGIGLLFFLCTVIFIFNS